MALIGATAVAAGPDPRDSQDGRDQRSDHADLHLRSRHVVPASVVYQTADHPLPSGSADWTAGGWPRKGAVNLEEYRNRWDLILAALT
jgi:hypothetical protein